VSVYPLIRWLLFRLDPETAHRLTVNAIRTAGALSPVNNLLRYLYEVPDQRVQAFGLEFPNPIGLAAGYDKDGIAWKGLACLGFGHIEIGTVTPKPQIGNPKPRLFRLPGEKALINRLGFPGKGADFVLKQISAHRPKIPMLGVNIGKNKDTPLEEAVQDYVTLLRLFSSQADYLTVNVSSPNTIGLRQLQERQALEKLLKQMNEERKAICDDTGHRIPILVKLSPDLTDHQLIEALEPILANEMDGVIATNTTIARDGVGPAWMNEEGGLSGQPLFSRSVSMVEKIYKSTQGGITVIGAGGVHDADSARKMLDAGATLVQIYTSLVYEGPGVVNQILLGI
jgi:dihydroorotate dehydrogenase